MKLTVTIKMDNAAFHDGDNGNELARILRGLAERLDNATVSPGAALNLRDVNGNTVGEARVSGR